MKPAFLFLAILFASCTRPVPPQSTPETPPELAQSVTAHTGHVLAKFENGAQGAVYFSGGASVVLPQKGQFEIPGNTFPDATGYICSDPNTGDYLHIYKSGFARAKIRGVGYNLMPESGTKIEE